MVPFQSFISRPRPPTKTADSANIILTEDPMGSQRHYPKASSTWLVDYHPEFPKNIGRVGGFYFLFSIFWKTCRFDFRQGVVCRWISHWHIHCTCCWNLVLPYHHFIWGQPTHSFCLSLLLHGNHKIITKTIFWVDRNRSKCKILPKLIISQK